MAGCARPFWALLVYRRPEVYVVGRFAARGVCCVNVRYHPRRSVPRPTPTRGAMVLHRTWDGESLTVVDVARGGWRCAG